MKTLARRFSTVISGTAVLSFLVGCSVAGPMADEINPYGQGNNVQVLGNRDSTALGGTGASKEAESARHALEVLGSYRRAQAPQPAYPVVQPAEVRLMWVPDHQNKHGDLVPAHFYYLRVLNDRFAVQDAFEVEDQYKQGSGQINYGTTGGGTGGGTENYGSGTAGSSTPWVYKESK